MSHIRFATVAGAAVALALAAGAAHASDPGQLYSKGRAAFDRAEPDYVAALEYLSAYREVAGSALASDPGFGRTLDRAIDHAAAQLSLALRTKRQLDKYGEVREVTIEASGKADGATPVSVNVRLPSGSVPAKPRLADRPPSPAHQATVAESTRIVVAGRPTEPVQPPSPPASVDRACQERVAACTQKGRDQAERLKACEGKLDTVAQAARGAREAAACHERLSEQSERCEQLQDRFNALAARYLELEERCSPR